MYKTNFWDVPALRRVEPVSTSGPVGSSMATRDSALSGVPSLLLMPMVAHPALAAWRTEETT
jgi:hypothetical protein